MCSWQTRHSLRTSRTKLSCSWTGLNSLTQNIRAQYHRRQPNLIQQKKAHYTHHNLIWSKWIAPVMARSVQFIARKRPKNNLWPENNTFIYGFGIFLIFYSFQSRFWPVSCRFKENLMIFKMVYNLPQSDGRIKKSTFWPLLLRFWSALIKLCQKGQVWDSEILDGLFRHPIKINTIFQCIFLFS